jgi:hypothetical protein
LQLQHLSLKTLNTNMNRIGTAASWMYHHESDKMPWTMNAMPTTTATQMYLSIT